MSEDDKLNELLVKCWRDAETRARFVANPKQVLTEFGIELPPPAIDIVVVEDTATKVHVVLPPAAPTKVKGELSDDQLDAVSGGAATTLAQQKTLASNATLLRLRSMQVSTTTAQTCSMGNPYVDPCTAVSQRIHKKDIGYLSHDDERCLADELMSFRLATYHYTSESSSDPRHLGFIIDDIAPSSVAVAKDGKHVDLYSYMTMAVATLQVQQQQISALQKQVDELKRETEKTRAS